MLEIIHEEKEFRDEQGRLKCIMRIRTRDPPPKSQELIFDASKEVADLKAKLKAQGIVV